MSKSLVPMEQVCGAIQAMEPKFAATLPSHIPANRFVRTVLTAVQQSPDLANADRPSLFNAALKAATDGLLPDGREAALVTFNTKKKGADGKESWVKQVQYMPMVSGILKKIRNSGDLSTISAAVVYQRDVFDYTLGDDERIHHKPYLEGDPGPARLVYAIAKLKDGAIYREVMTVAEVEKVRAASRAKDSGPWVQWWGEMAKKTVIRRLSKRLPMSTDLDEFIRQDDGQFGSEIAPPPADNDQGEPMVGASGFNAAIKKSKAAKAKQQETDVIDVETGEVHTIDHEESPLDHSENDEGGESSEDHLF